MAFLKRLHLRPNRNNREKELETIPPIKTTRDLASAPPRRVLETIFAHVCPHALDESYDKCENSILPDRCCLCDLRDLANCAQVARLWYDVATSLLYHSVRIDVIHFCDLEKALSAKRKKKHIDPLQVPLTRVKLLQKTLWCNKNLAATVQLLKLAPQARDSSVHGDLARIVSVLPNLRHIDLPDKFYRDDASCRILREELVSKCPGLRKMEYHVGAETAFDAKWPCLEVVDLDGLKVTTTRLKTVLATLPALCEIFLRNMAHVDDTLFRAEGPDFPPVQRLHLQSLPKLTSDGLLGYLPITTRLTTLTLKHTGVSFASLPAILRAAPRLTDFTLTEYVSEELQLTQLKSLESKSVETINFEILPTDKFASDQKLPGAYYYHLASSICANGLPSLQKLYVCDLSFPERLLATNSSRSGSRPAQYFELYARGETELDWILMPSSNSATDESPAKPSRPVSTFFGSRESGSQWLGQARKSAFVADGSGAFHAVPPTLGSDQELETQARPTQSRKERRSLWS